MKLRFVLILLCVCVLLSACETKPAVVTEPITEPVTESVPVPTETEPAGLEWVPHTLRPQTKRTDFISADRGSERYYYESKFWDEARSTETAENLIAFLDRVRGLAGDESEHKLIVYTGDCITTWAEPGKAYISSEDTDSVRGYWYALQADCAELRHPGLAYGLTAVLCRDMGLCQPQAEKTDGELADYFSWRKNKCMLDFTLPMLEPWYFGEDTTATMQAAALSFADYLCRERSAEEAARLAFAGNEEELETATNDWMHAMGMTQSYTRENVPAFRLVEKPDDDFPYYTDTETVVWCFMCDDVKEYGYESFLEEYRYTADLAELDFADAREEMKAFAPDPVPTVTVYTEFNLDDRLEHAAAYYDNDQIHIYYNWGNARYSIVHEYMHHLTIGKGRVLEHWSLMTEALAEEAAVFSCENRCARDFYGLYDQEMAETAVELEDLTFAEAQWMATGRGRGSYLCIAQFVRTRPDPMTADALSYAEAASFMHFLVERFGREDIYRASVGIWEMEEFCGAPFSELYEAWKVWNTEQCRQRGLQV